MPGPDEATISAAIAKLKRSEAFRHSERALDYVAVCLVGHREPVPVAVGSNATKFPVRVATSRDPAAAAKRADMEQPIHALETLAYVWTASEAHARRLKAALDARILGDDPDMTQLRHNWRDMPAWEVAWPILLNEAIADLRAGGETIEAFSEDIRIQRVRRHAQQRVRQ